MSRFDSLEWAKVRRISEHLEWQFIAQYGADPIRVRREVFVGQEELQQWAPVVIGRTRVVKAEYVRATGNSRRGVVQLGKVPLEDRRDRLVEGRAEVQPGHKRDVHSFRASINRE